MCFFPLIIQWRSNCTVLCILLSGSFNGFPSAYRKRNYSLVYAQHLRNCFQPALLALSKLASTIRWVNSFGRACAPLLVLLPHLECPSYSLHIPEASHLSKTRHTASPPRGLPGNQPKWLPPFQIPPAAPLAWACFPPDGSVLTSFRSLLLKMNFLRLWNSICIPTTPFPFPAFFFFFLKK